eukprot:TRINITY_DN47675_c0_g1_i1.p1 TRINITY_DN47675_c0_g1~~TRINITY_DN47675_c0_g1_i1.p1  ORF type:complete len:341 (+),score=42.77 TRINITY_DN47675_c0_g1_i1:27-1049(+)
MQWHQLECGKCGKKNICAAFVAGMILGTSSGPLMPLMLQHITSPKVNVQDQTLQALTNDLKEMQARIQILENENGLKNHAQGYTFGKRAQTGLFANIQVGAYPFDQNFVRTRPPPSEIWIEIGANSRDVMQDSPEMKAAFAKGAVLLTFEPLLDKYASLMSRYGGRPDTIRQLGLQHERGLVFPYAVGCDGSAEFHVAAVDGCSSVLPMAEDNFAGDPEAAAKWAPWVAQGCAKALEKRTVPCVSLEQVIGEWLGGRAITHVKIDAQGFDLNVVKSAGQHINKLKSVHMEVQCDTAAMLYKGQPNCTSVYAEMTKLGFQTTFDPQRCKTCVEGDIDFTHP